MKKTILGTFVGALLVLFIFMLQNTYELVRVDRLLDKKIESFNPSVQQAFNLTRDSDHLILDKSHIVEKKDNIQSYNQEVKTIDRTETLSQKEQLIAKLNLLDSNQIAALHATISEMDNPLPKSRFAKEKVDPIWSLKKQSDLEYTFYQQAVFIDKGRLESIRCKTTICRVSIELNEGNSLSASDILSWSTPSQVVYSNTNESSTRTVEIYVELSRDG